MKTRCTIQKAVIFKFPLGCHTSRAALFSVESLRVDLEREVE